MDAAKAEAAKKQSAEPPRRKSPARVAKKQTADPPKVKSPGRANTGGKTPKPKEKVTSKTSSKTDDNATDRGIKPKKKIASMTSSKADDTMMDQVVKPKKRVTAKTSKETQDGATNREATDKSKKCKAPQHIDDEDYDLDLNTGRFVKCKKTLTLEDDDIEEYDDKDKDADYDPDKDADQGDDDNDNDDNDEEANEEDDDFPIPPLRARKSVGKSSDRSKAQKKKDTDDLADFVEQTFSKKKQPVRRTRSSRDDDDNVTDSCINPKEAAKFRAAMWDEAQALEDAVWSGVNVKEAYQELIANVIVACKEMNYEIPSDLDVGGILPAVEDPTCKAWQLKLQGIQTAGEGELNLSKADNAGVCVAKKKYEIRDIAQYVEKICKDWTPLKQKNLKEVMKRVMGNMSVAHQMVSEACQELISLLDEVNISLWCKLVDMTTRPLVIMEVPEVTVMCEEACQLSRENQRHWNQNTEVTTIMEAQNLPFLPMAWGYRAEDRAKKVVAGIIYKYVRDQMYGYKVVTPATEVGTKYGLNVMTMNRHILGKKYAGGKASTSGTKPKWPVAVKATARPVEESKGKPAPTKKKEQKQKETMKGKGKGKSSSVSRTAEEIRGESTSEDAKEKARKRKDAEAVLEEEYEDRPMAAEIAASKLARKGIVIHN